MAESTHLHYRAKAASLSRSLPADHPDVVDAKRSMHALKLEAHVAAVVAKAPPFTDDQRARIVAALNGGSR